MVSASPLTRSSHHAGEDFAKLKAARAAAARWAFAKMPRFSNKRRVQHRAEQMFDLVADVERYPEFVPLCQALKVRQRKTNADGTETIVADMTVSFKLVKETFTSEVTLDKPNLKIVVRYLRGRSRASRTAGPSSPGARRPAMSASSSPTSSRARCSRR